MQPIQAAPHRSQVTEKRRLPRVNLSSEQFRLSQNGRLFWVTDLSNSGFGVRISQEEDRILFTVGHRIEGLLHVRDRKLRVFGRVRHLGLGGAGIEFEGLDTDAAEFIQKFLDPHSLAQGLKRMPALEERLAWWSGAGGTELWVWHPVENGEFERAVLLMWGHFVEWAAQGQVTTGLWSHSLEEPDVRGAMRFETLLFKPDAAGPDRAQLKVAKTFLLSSNLPENLKERLAQGL
jgi:hypothetical protein